jgi:hypothetical protein
MFALELAQLFQIVYVIKTLNALLNLTLVLILGKLLKVEVVKMTNHATAEAA